MRRFLALGLIAGLATFGCVGESTKPGSVEYVVPAEVITLKQNESRDIKISRKGKDLKAQDLSIASSDPKLTVEGGKFKGDAKEATITVKAAADAAPDKEQTLTFKVGDVTKTIKVKVVANGPPPQKVKLSIKEGSLTLKQGESKEVTVSREGGEVANALDLEVSSSEPKVSAEGPKSFKGGEKDAKITINAADDAPTDKEATVTVKAGGQSQTIKVKVDKKK